MVTPYLEYPQLLGVLLRMLNEGAPAVRQEVLKVRHFFAWRLMQGSSCIASLIMMLCSFCVSTC